MNRVIQFEIHADDPERAARFYRTVFGWDVREWVVPGAEIPEHNRYWLATTGPKGEPGIDGGVLVRRGAPPVEGQAVNACVCTIGVASVDESVSATFELPKMPIRSVGWLVSCTDTEGNRFGVIQEDPGAV